MRHRALVCAVAAASSAALLSTAQAGPRAVIELFTSQGCSSCPAADQLIGELAQDPGIVAVSLPINYWDYLGWKDTLADPRNAARQRAYSKVRGDGEVYTPQVVVNGSLHVIGSDKGAIERAIVKSHENVATMELPVTLSAADGRLTVTVPDHVAARPAEVWVWGLAKATTVAIKRGENRGKTITYHNVARRWVNLGVWTGKQNTWTIPLRDIQGNGVDEAALLVQAGSVEKPSAILGASLVAFH